MKKAPTPSTANGAFQDHSQQRDFNPTACFLSNPEPKAVANLTARLALAGHVVHKGQNSDFLVCKYGMSRYCQDAGELAAFAKKLGVIRE